MWCVPSCGLTLKQKPSYKPSSQTPPLSLCCAHLSKPGFPPCQLLPKERGERRLGLKWGVAREPEGGETTDIRCIQKWKEGEPGRRRRVWAEEKEGERGSI